MIRSYVFKLQISARLGRQIEAAMQLSNDLYNAALHERIDAYSNKKKSISKFDQMKSLTEIRAGDPAISRYPVTLLRTPLVQVDEAFKGFYSRVRKGGAVGFPRFRSIKRVRSIGFVEASGWRIKGTRLLIKGLPYIRLKMHRKLFGVPLKLTIKKRASGWVAIIVVRLPDFCGPAPAGVRGYDLGISKIITDSDGAEHGRISPERESSPARLVIERSLARQKRGSQRWRKTQKRLARQRSREASRRRTAHFQKASQIVRSTLGTLVLEKLQIKNMTRSAKGTLEAPGKNVSAKAGLNRSLQDSGLSQFTKILTDKAESAGRRVIFVDPKNTSQLCSGCSVKVPKTLSIRRHRCECGVNLDRDHNAAINILNRGVVAAGQNRLAA